MNNNVQPNSHKYKDEKTREKKIEPIINGGVKTKKKSEFSKLSSIFISEDASNVKSYIFMDVLVPAIKKAISDIVRDGIDMILYGGSGRSDKSRSNPGGVSYVNYRQYADPRDRTPAAQAKTRFDYDDILFENRGQAEAVREQMEEIISRYGIVTVADMYDSVNLTAPYTANKYGWTNIRTAEPVRVRNGYILKLPKPSPID